MSEKNSICEVIFDMSFYLGALWRRISENDSSRMMDALNGSRGLYDWLFEQAAEFERLWREGKTFDEEDYYGEVDKYFVARLDELLASYDITLREVNPTMRPGLTAQSVIDRAKAESPAS